jgi:cyclopropane-fatty-acyl-phospholipid synthase
VALRTTEPLRREIGRSVPERPFRIELWDGSGLAPTEPGGPTFTVRSPRALAHALRAPGQLGIGRAYVAGDLEVDDMDAVIGVLENWKPPVIDTRARARLLLAAARACGPMLPPSRPASELIPKGARHSRERDARAVRHHYDVPTEFFGLFLDESMTYSCAVFSKGATTLEEAQEEKLEMVCRKLGLGEGMHVLDVGCGWGSFALHAAERHGVRVTGITLSTAQAAAAKRRVAAAGMEDRIEIRVQDYRDLPGESFDAISSIGMVEHVGDAQIDTYAETLASLLPSGGRLLNHGIARCRHTDPDAGPFSERYVFPDAEPLHLSRILVATERAGFVTNDVEELAKLGDTRPGGDYAETLRHWAAHLDENLDEAIRLAGPERVRVWRLYIRAARNGFEVGFTSTYQVLCTKA